MHMVIDRVSPLERMCVGFICRIERYNMRR